MRLAEFMRDNEERILHEWEDFASGLRSAPSSMDEDDLRDHALGMLRCIAGILETGHDAARAHWVSPRGREETAAEAHGGDRHEWGFSIDDMMAEFRALRRSVVRLWGNATDHMDAADLIRFNEAIDRELAESLDTYIAETEYEARLLKAMLSHTSDYSSILDRDGRFLYVNRALAEAYGRHAHDIVGMRIDEVKPALAAEVHEHLRYVFDTRQERRGEFHVTTANGEPRVIEYLFAPILDDKGSVEAVTANSRDITLRKAGERQLWMHANHDPLTGVPNRRLFIDRLEQDMRLAKRHGETLALLYIDLDKFKDANDHLGHEGGDELLKQVTQRIGGCIRETDTLARMGGDEFTVILMDARDAEAVESVAQVMLDQLSRPFFIQHKTVHIAGSVGIALYPQNGETVNDLLVHADQAMYEAKGDGGGEYMFFDPKGAAHARSANAHPRRETH